MNNIEAKDITHRLASRADAVAAYLLPSGRLDGNEWRSGDVSGAPGQSLGVHLTGDKAGVWTDFATGEGGDLLDLWQSVRGVDFKQALQEAAEYLGVDTTTERPRPKAKPLPVRTSPPDGVDGVSRFTYTDASKRPVIYVTRQDTPDGKRIRQWGHGPDGKGWMPSLKHAPNPRPLYRLPAILKAGGTVCIHEGEKAVVAAWKASLHGTHTTTIGGAGNAHHSDFTPLNGRDVCIIPDNDEPGEKHAAQVARLATEAGAKSVRVVRLPGLLAKGDVVEWLAAGGTDEQWRKLIAEAKPADIKGGAADDWPDPVSLPSGLAPVNDFDAELLPEALRSFVTDIAERMQCPPDFPAVTVMVSLGALIGRRCGIHPKRKDDWLAVPNLWGAIVGRPSLMKSPAVQQGMKPFDALIAKASKKHAEAMTDYSIKAEAYAGKKDAWKKEVRKAATDGKPTDGMPPPVKPDEPIERRLRTNAGSVECLINLLNENPDGLMMFRDELTGWLRNLDKPGKEGDRQFYLEAWNGNGSGFDYDTFTHGHLHCDSLCLSMLGSIQPGPLSHLIADAAKGGGGDDGMIQRFQLLVYPDSPGVWHNIDRWPDTEAKARVRRIFERLDKMAFPATDEGIPALRFDNEAQALFGEWRAELEAKVSGEESTLIEAHLAKYRSLMPSLALLIHLAEVADREAALTPVTVDAAARAAAWCEYLESHARRVYGMHAMAEVEGARTLLAKLMRGDIQSPFTARQVYRNHWSRLASPAEVEAACGILQDHDWLRSEEVRGDTGRPTVTYTLNPKAAKKASGGLPTQVSKVPKPPFDTFGTALPSPLTDEKQAVTA